MSNPFKDLWIKKTTVHLTYDRKGEFVGSYVDDESKKGMFPNLQVSKIGIGAAGAIPNSLLARQDLEDKDKSVADDSSLYELKDDAKQAETEEEKSEVADKIKETQVKRQKATIAERKTEKSFKSAWSLLSSAK